MITDKGETLGERLVVYFTYERISSVHIIGNMHV